MTNEAGAHVLYLIKHAGGNAYYYGLTKTEFPEPSARVHRIKRYCGELGVICDRIFVFAYRSKRLAQLQSGLPRCRTANTFQLQKKVGHHRPS